MAGPSNEISTPTFPNPEIHLDGLSPTFNDNNPDTVRNYNRVATLALSTLALFAGGTAVASSFEASASRTKPMTPLRVLSEIQDIVMSGDTAPMPDRAYLSATSLKFTATCHGDNGVSFYQNTPSGVRDKPCMKGYPATNIKGGHGNNGLKFMYATNMLGSKIRSSYGIKGNAQDTRRISGTRASVKAIFVCPAEGTPDATYTSAGQLLKSMVIKKGHKKPTIVKC